MRTVHKFKCQCNGRLECVRFYCALVFTPPIEQDQSGEGEREKEKQNWWHNFFAIICSDHKLSATTIPLTFTLVNFNENSNVKHELAEKQMHLYSTGSDLPKPKRWGALTQLSFSAVLIRLRNSAFSFDLIFSFRCRWLSVCIRVSYEQVYAMLRHSRHCVCLNVWAWLLKNDRFTSWMDHWNRHNVFVCVLLLVLFLASYWNKTHRTGVISLCI